MKNVTLGNLQLIWQQLDDACGALDNARMNIHTIKNIPQEIKDDSERIDISEIVALKNKIEELIEEKDG